ncbi:MAG: GntR family transcriptional regulator [Spirochaetia bacterium]|jgi:DNA-binding GntR family transcriptional regulator
MSRVFVNTGAIDQKTISDQVYDHIKRLILSGSLAGGEKIPETGIADQLNVSRTPVREATRKLAEYGLVVIRPRSYALVATIGPKEARDISLVRLSLEKLSFRCFASVATDSSLTLLRGLAAGCSQALEVGDFAGAFELDSRLHLGIAQHTGNVELFNMLRNLDAKLQLLRLKQHLPPTLLSVYNEQHETLLELVRNKELPEIDGLLERHILHHLDFL